MQNMFRVNKKNTGGHSGCFLTAIMHLLEFIKIVLVIYIKVKPPETYYEQGRKVFRVIL